MEILQENSILEKIHQVIVNLFEYLTLKSLRRQGLLLGKYTISY